MARYRLPLFAHISIDCVLCRLPGAHQLSADRETLTIDLDSLSLFNSLYSEKIRNDILRASDALIKGRRKAAKRGKKQAARTANTVEDSRDIFSDIDGDD